MIVDNFLCNHNNVLQNSVPPYAMGESEDMNETEEYNKEQADVVNEIVTW